MSLHKPDRLMKIEHKKLLTNVFQS